MCILFLWLEFRHQKILQNDFFVPKKFNLQKVRAKRVRVSFFGYFWIHDHRPQINDQMRRASSFASFTQLNTQHQTPPSSSKNETTTTRESSLELFSRSMSSSNKSSTDNGKREDTSMAAIHAALVQAGLGAAADKITTLMELSKKAQRTGIQQEFFDSCNTFDSPQQRIHRAALFIDDALHGRTLKVQRLTPWAVWIYKLEQSSTFSSIMLCCDLLFLYCSVFAPLLRPHTIKKNDMGLSPIDYPSSQLYVELACLLMFTLQLSLTLYHSYGAVFFRIVDKHMVPVFMNITNAIMLFIFWLDFLICVVGRADHPRYVMLLWIFRFFHDLRPGVPSTFWAIITCVPILDVILLILLILVMFAFYGVTLFHGLYDSSEWQHFDSMGPAMLSLYILMTGDNVPDILTPALTEPLGSLDNVYFFILFCLAASFFVLPIPLAVILESFKVNRAQQVIVSEVTEKKALLAAFHCLDAEKKGTLTRGEFSELIHFIYTDTSAIKIMMELFDLIDEDGSGELDQLEFFTLSDSITYTLRYASVHVEEIQRSLEQALRRLQRIFSGQGRKGEAEKTMSSGSQRSNSTSDSTWRSNISRSEDGTTRKRVRSNRKSYHERFGTTNAFGSSMQENHVSCCTKCCVIPSICWLKWRLFADVKLRLARLVFSPWFEGGIMLVVLVNSNAIFTTGQKRLENIPRYPQQLPNC
jgi:hypothetical protein